MITLIKWLGLVLMLSILASCTTRKEVVYAPEYNIIVEEKGASLRDDFEKNVGHQIFFAFDSASLSKEAKDRLAKQANWLIYYPSVKVTIEGHCDERGSQDYNKALGFRRAMAAEKYLISHGVSKERLSVVSYGKDRPAALGHDKEAWRINRRAVTVTILTM
jgi:peptidoglycan-associated lipoprotein